MKALVYRGLADKAVEERPKPEFIAPTETLFNKCYLFP